jgi:hypothetical protein
VDSGGVGLISTIADDAKSVPHCAHNDQEFRVRCTCPGECEEISVTESGTELRPDTELRRYGRARSYAVHFLWTCLFFSFV